MEDSPQPLPEAWRLELRRGLKSLRAGEFERAELHFARAHRWAPERPEVCYALGRERMRHGDVGEAERLLRTAWRGDPSLVSAAATLARCLSLHMGRHDDAHAVLDDAAERHGPLPMLEVVRSEVHLEQDRVDDARTAAESALSRCEDAFSATREAARAALARVYNHEGVALAERGELDGALFRFKRAADCDPNWSSPHVNMGAAFATMGKQRRARVAYELAVKTDPCNAIAHLNLGLLLRDQGELTAAHAMLVAATELDPDLNAARAALADTCLRLGDPDTAAEMLSEVVESVPDDADAWVDLGTALGAAGERSGAEDCLRHALELCPGHAQAIRRLADLLAREGRYLEAAVLAQQTADAGDSTSPFTKPS